MEEVNEITQRLQNTNKPKTREDRLLEMKQQATRDGYFPTFLTCRQIAEQLNLCVDTIRTAIGDGRLNAYDISCGNRHDYRSTTMDVLEYVTRKDPSGVARILKQRQIELQVEELTDFKGLIKKYQKLAGARGDDRMPSAPETSGNE